MTAEFIVLIVAIILLVMTLLMQLLILAPIMFQIFLILKKVHNLLDVIDSLVNFSYRKGKEFVSSLTSRSKKDASGSEDSFEK